MSYDNSEANTPDEERWEDEFEYEDPRDVARLSTTHKCPNCLDELQDNYKVRYVSGRLLTDGYGDPIEVLEVTDFEVECQHCYETVSISGRYADISLGI